ncbi:sigma 54-interacting transcriptional regulator [Vagococcus acidifermentans]|uniref:DNA translocase FtsK n=1 Tax=Vagococcus acidifermentans TaxID=564710 RepID=A0A430AQH5_9ENTE|nr:sigma-54-dependent transcriptional regulator [Vagococcus acidifermentans]RSU10233.1 ArsR family transcriptional regulator [Vagococcus acidifermentans]
MLNKKDQIFNILLNSQESLSTTQIAEQIDLDRSTVSRYLNELYKEEQIERIEGRPVLFKICQHASGEGDSQQNVSFDNLVGADESLKVSIQQAKAAMLYPPRGLHTIIFGESGTGKSLFAECMYEFAVQPNILKDEAPFISFNCADYAQNPQLLFSHIFGVKKGAFTGADADRVGLIGEADGGILFLDEIHRLPPEGQEMLFTFIDKGMYRPLGESSMTHSASVQIIGATTESADIFLATFKRRIPMSITLPPLSERTLDERYAILTLFLKQEANRLNQRITVDRNAIAAFMLYEAEGNIGQVKRDLKLVCAKAFLHYRTHQEEYLTINQSDLPLHVQKGLLKIKEVSNRLDRFIDANNNYLTFDPGSKDIVWSQDPAKHMDVYETIDEKVASLSKVGLKDIDLEKLIATDVNKYFQVYVDELSRSDVHRDLIEDRIWTLTDRLYDLAESRLSRTFNERTRFTFALHLQSTIERIQGKKSIIHPNLNDVRKKNLNEFQVAMEWSSIIEQEFDIDIPFDEIGFMTMFLSVDIADSVVEQENNVKVVLLMHGKSTASSMLEAVQELLGTETGIAFNMPLTMEVKQMYEQVKNYIINQHDALSGGVLLLTDMGSLNSFSDMIHEETGIRTKAISMVSTLIVLEAVRMASIGRSLNEIYENIQTAYETSVRNQFRENKQLKKAVIVTCFTGEGVAAKLYQRIRPVVNEAEVKIIQMQFLEKSAFKQHIDELMERYDIRAIVGTVEMDYQHIPFFSAFDIFRKESLEAFARVVAADVPIEKMVDSLSETITAVPSLRELLEIIQKIVQKIQMDLNLIIDPSVTSGIIIHTAFLVENILLKNDVRKFPDLAAFKRSHRYEMDVVRTNILPLESYYHIMIPDSEIAYLTEMYLNNQLESSSKTAH